jgi:hypothetical protein
MTYCKISGPDDFALQAGRRWRVVDNEHGETFQAMLWTFLRLTFSNRIGVQTVN